MVGSHPLPPIAGTRAAGRTVSGRPRPANPSADARDPARGRTAWIPAVLGILLTGPAPALAQPPGMRAIPVAVLPIKLLDTSGEPTDQTADHAERLERLGRDLSTDLTGLGLYRMAYLPAERVAEACPAEDAGCLRKLAHDQGAELLFIGVVHKSSTLILQLWARLVDVRTGRSVFSRDLNFRGDTDEAWRRAREFLVAQMQETRSER